MASKEMAIDNLSRSNSGSIKIKFLKYRKEKKNCVLTNERRNWREILI